MTETPDPFAQPSAPPPQPPQPPQPPPAQGYPPPPGYPPEQGYAAPPAAGYPPPPGYAPQQGYEQPAYPPPYGAPPGGYPGQPYPGQQQNQPSGLAIAALVVGILACLGFWIPFAGALLGVVALILGIVAWRKASAGRGGAKGMAIAGTILGILAVLGGILATIFIVWIIKTTSDCYDPSFSDAQTQSCIEDSVNNRFGVE